MNRCVLIFDDDPDILEVCKIILERHNYQVATRLVCDNVLSDIAAVNPAIVLMDLRIPRIGGETATKLIKSSEKFREIPVLIISANAGIDAISNQSGANGFLRKPFDMDTLIEKVEAMWISIH